MTRHISSGSDDTFPTWENDAFAARLNEAAERLKATAYSLSGDTGIAQSLIRSYMKGDSIPGADKLVLLAKALHVSISWLASGEHDQPAQAPLGQPQIDYDKLEEVIAKTRRMIQTRRLTLKPEAEARVIRLIYEYVQRQGKDMDAASMDNVIELAAFR